MATVRVEDELPGCPDQAKAAESAKWTRLCRLCAWQPQRAHLTRAAIKEGSCRVGPAGRVGAREIRRGRREFERQSVQPLFDFLGNRSTDPCQLRQKHYCPALCLPPVLHHPVDQPEDLAHFVRILREIVQFAHQLPFGPVTPGRITGSAQRGDLGTSHLDRQRMIVPPIAVELVDQLADRKPQSASLLTNLPVPHRSTGSDRNTAPSRLSGAPWGSGYREKKCQDSFVRSTLRAGLRQIRPDTFFALFFRAHSHSMVAGGLLLMS